ncbi:ankyrin repeat and death domain-containing protein 1A-like [Ctenocephalides felis]|uniref:ankyrin repeat and death domain-containing protein 1A-like n=1 Tax=Ctenocephalides felis TaxID=7515 RepID=UPI000E6E596D|nr:ankyrin repeat and death domain-containing protein 1A-like [Ctenocephalides felis]
MRPLLMAAWHGHIVAVRMLIGYGACVTVLNKKHYGILTCAARNGHADCVAFLLQTVETLDKEQGDLQGRTALHHAAAQGHADTVKKLLESGSSLMAKDKGGRTPLHLAAEGGHVAVCELLSSRGDTNSKSLSLSDQGGCTPLHLAVMNKHCEATKALLTLGASAECVNEKGFTPLHLACRLGCRGITETLIQFGAPLNKQAKNGNTPLHEACLSNEMELMELLISKGADLNCVNVRNEAPIHLAAELGRTEACRMLLAAGADLSHQQDTNGSGPRSPMFLAARGSFTAIVDMIIQTARLDYPTKDDDDQAGDGYPCKTKPIINTARRKLLSTGDSSDWTSVDEPLVPSACTLPTTAASSTCNSEDSEHLQKILHKLSHRFLQDGDWRALASHWAFTEDQIKAIEHQYAGPNSYKEHGYRMLTIWLNALPRSAVPSKELCSGLRAIGRDNIAQKVTAKLLKESQKSESRHRDRHLSQCVVI